MPCCEISDRAQMSKTIIAVRHFALGGRESLETAVIVTIILNVDIWKLFKVLHLYTLRFARFSN